MIADENACKTCSGSGVVEENGRREPCPEPNCLKGALARIFRKKER